MVSVSRAELGAWLLRCSPARTDLSVRFAAPIRSWCVAANYRSVLMAPEDPVLLWVSGRDPRFPRGIWGRGRLTGPAEPGPDGLRVELDLVVGDTALITDAELRDVGVTDLEVQRMPQGSNPSWVSRAQLDRIPALR